MIFFSRRKVIFIAGSILLLLAFAVVMETEVLPFEIPTLVWRSDLSVSETGQSSADVAAEISTSNQSVTTSLREGISPEKLVLSLKRASNGSFPDEKGNAAEITPFVSPKEITFSNSTAPSISTTSPTTSTSPTSASILTKNPTIHTAVPSSSPMEAPTTPSPVSTSSPSTTVFPLRIHISGEPISFEPWGNGPRKADISIVGGGGNLEPGRTWFSSISMSGFVNLTDFPRPQTAPINARNFSDVLYRQSNCSPQREKSVGIIRKIVEAANFTFKATGFCGGLGYPHGTRVGEFRDYTICDIDCGHSKLMLSIERFQPPSMYLSEKLFIPLLNGAIPVYKGNGHRWMDLFTLNRKCFVDHDKFGSDEALGAEIVRLLQNPSELEQMRAEPLFLDPENARNRMLFLHEPERVGVKGYPELYEHVWTHPRFKPFLNKPVLKYIVLRKPYYHFEKMVRVLLNASSIVQITDHAQYGEADFELDMCC